MTTLETKVSLVNERNSTKKKFTQDQKNFGSRRAISRFRLSSYKRAVVTGKWYNIEKHRQTYKLCSESAIENEIHLLLGCLFYKDLRNNLFLGILETDGTDLSYGNRFEESRILFTQRSLNTLELLGDYIRKAIRKRGTALTDQTVSKNNLQRLKNAHKTAYAVYTWSYYYYNCCYYHCYYYYHHHHHYYYNFLN